MSAPATTSLIDPRCRVCTHERRAELEAALLLGQQSVRAIARAFDVGRDSLRRHALRHVAIGERSSFLGAPGLRAVDIAERLADVLDHAAEVRADADARGDDRLALKASSMIAVTTMKLADRLGIAESDITRDVAELDAIAAAVERVVRELPQVGDVLADVLRENGEHAMAKLIGDFAQRQRAALEATPTT